jgi:replicative DNA helicase
MLAREMAVPVLALAGVKRSVEMRRDKRPSQFDLCESDAITQYADTIALLYRDEYYDADSRQAGVAEIIIERPHRDDDDVAKLIFIRELMKFESFDPLRHPQDPAIFCRSGRGS